MNLFDLTQIGLERAIQGASLRQSTLSDNLANVNTPGYVRRDVDFHSALRDALAGDGSAAEARVEQLGFSPQADHTVQLRADGNGVDADVESARLSENALEYQTLVQVAKARQDIVRSALGVG